MRISIFGLGYVGTVTSACMARDGHQVIGVDVNLDKVRVLAAGRSPIMEPGLEELLAAGSASGAIVAIADVDQAVISSDATFVSVGTPSADGGLPDLTYVERVCREIAEVLARTRKPHVVVMRSTVPPGTTERLQALMEGVCGPGLVDVAFNPEFLREGSAIQDFYDPPYTIIGTKSPRAEAVLRELYTSVKAEVILVAPAVAELTKYVANAWHATKIVFANEIGRLARSSGVDGREIMGIMARDTKLNISPAYLRPGFAYGGSCLPKDVRALLARARLDNTQLPLLSALPESNAQQIDIAVTAILRTGLRDVALLGLAFKAATDDLRESPAVTLVKRLLGEGNVVRIYAPDVNRARLMGTNLQYIRTHLPHFEGLLTDDLPSLLKWGEVIVIAQSQDEFRRALVDDFAGKTIVDLDGAFVDPPSKADYFGIAW